MGNKKTFFEFRNITKTFPGVLAIDDVSFSLRKGEVHALVGENGAGKSTLIKTAAGAHKPSSGTIVIEGEEYKGFNPHSSKELGIGVIYQEFNLVNELTVWENLFLGREIKVGKFLKKKEMKKRALQVFDQLDIKIDINDQIKNLSVGYQQLVEIGKVLITDIKVLIMDEPTAPLTDAEVETLFKLIRTLKASGVSIIYISHRLEEIFEVSDRVSVMRDGKLITTMDTNEITRDTLITMMVGREIKNIFPKEEPQITDEVLLEMEGVSGNGFENLNMKLYRGEILGLGGLVGAGRTEMAQLIFGTAKIKSGKLKLKGKEIHVKSPKDAIAHGIVLVPENRKEHGILAHMSIAQNITLAMLSKISFLSWINRSKERKIIDKYKNALTIKAPSIQQLVKNLSGGNQQKVVVAKWLAAQPDLIIMDEPTRGIDVGAKYEIYILINEMVKQGKTIIMISSEMPELMGMSDRILVLCERKIRAQLKREEFSQEKIMHYASKVS